MATRVTWDNSQSEYFKSIPRTLEEAFGPHSRLSLVEVDTRPHATVTLRWVLKYVVKCLVALAILSVALAVKGKFYESKDPTSTARSFLGQRADLSGANQR